MKGGEARNRRIVVIVVIALLVVAAEAGALYKMVSMILRGESPRQVQAQSSAERLDLTGEWVQTNSPSEQSYQAVRIADETIDIYWISEAEGIYMLYWSGTFHAPDTKKDVYSWLSENDTERTSTSRRGSQETEKEFRYEGGVLRYPTADGEVTAERREWGHAAAAASAAAPVSQGERLEGAGDLGDYHIEINGAELVRDSAGNPSVIVTYTWTNNSEATASAMVMLLDRASQGETRLEAAQMGRRPGYDVRSVTRNVPPGGTASVQRAYRLAEEGGTLTFAVREFLDQGGTAVVKEFELQ